MTSFHGATGSSWFIVGGPSTGYTYAANDDIYPRNGHSLWANDGNLGNGSVGTLFDDDDGGSDMRDAASVVLDSIQVYLQTGSGTTSLTIRDANTRTAQLAFLALDATGATFKSGDVIASNLRLPWRGGFTAASTNNNMWFLISYRVDKRQIGNV